MAGRDDSGAAAEDGSGTHSGRIAKAERYRVETEPDRGIENDGDRQAWSVFQRDEAGRPMRHVGRVHAEDAAAAHRQASTLFAWHAPEVWVCPATALTRFSTAGDPDDDPATPDSGDEPRTVEF